MTVYKQDRRVGLSCGSFENVEMKMWKKRTSGSGCRVYAQLYKFILVAIRYLGELARRGILSLNNAKCVAVDLLAGKPPSEDLVEYGCEFLSLVGEAQRRDD